MVERVFEIHLFTCFLCTLLICSASGELNNQPISNNEQDFTALLRIEKEDLIGIPENDVTALQPVILNKLLSPQDTIFEQQAKSLIAQYILALALQNAGNLTQNDTANAAATTSKPEEISTTGKPIAIEESVSTKAPEAVTTHSTKQSTPATTIVATTGTVAGIIDTISNLPNRQQHVLNQVEKILQNVSQGNISGIVDQSLAIRTPSPVRNLVNGIMSLVFCYPWDRVLGRCRGMNMNGATSGSANRVSIFQ